MFESENRIIERVVASIHEDWFDKEVTVPKGKFSGRKGRVCGVIYDTTGRGICMQIRPYRMERRGQQTITTNVLLWDHVDARKYWPMEGIKLDDPRDS